MRLTEFISIDEVIDNLVPVFLNHNGLIPMDWTPARKNVMFSLSDDFANRLIQLANKIVAEDLAKIYVSPSHFMKAAHKFQNVCKQLDFDKEIVLSTYMKMCNAAVLGWKVQVAKIQDMLKMSPFWECSPAQRESIAYLNSLVRAFSELVYCDDHTIGGDICGPIKTCDGLLLARQFVRIRPVELFDVLNDFKITSLSTYCIYDDIDISVDLIGNLTQCNNMVKSLKKCFIEVVTTDGQLHSIEYKYVPALIAYIEEWLTKAMTHYYTLTETQRIKLLFICEFYAFKPLFDYYNIPWEPASYELNENPISKDHRGKELRKQLASLTNQADIIECTKKILDPRL